MAKTRRLNIAAIRSCLIETQDNFDAINATLKVKRRPLSNEVINNLSAGYQKIDHHIANDIDLFKMGNSKLLLELNHIVLYQHANISVEENKSQFKATKTHFYEAKDGNIGNLMEWLALSQSKDIWRRTAGVFTHILSEPQLFLEGNHRTGSLIMSYMMMKEGYAPFVLSPQNAKHFFEPAELTKKRRKNTFDELIALPKQTRKFAKLLKSEQSDAFFL